MILMGDNKIVPSNKDKEHNSPKEMPKICI